MSRLPTPGGDDGTWGQVLNDFLGQIHNADGTIKASVIGAAALNAGTGSNGQVLTYNSGAAGGFNWTTPSAVGTAGGDLVGTYPNPTLTTTANVRTVLRGIGTKVFNITDPKYGTAGQGSAVADTAALAAAFADAVTAGGGVVYAPAGTYKINSWPSVATVGSKLPYALRGDGKNITIFQSYATSLATSLTITCPSYNTSDPAEGATEWSGFTIDGTNASGGASGIHWQNVSSVTFRDLAIQHFTTGDAFYFNNVNGWCERVTIVSVETTDCLRGLHFDVQTGGYGSFDYWDVAGIYMSVGVDQSAVVSEVSKSSLGTSIDRTGTRFRLVANLAAGFASNSGKLFWIKGFDKWGDIAWNVNAEPSGGNTFKHATVQIDSTDGYINGSGTFVGYYLGPVVLGSGLWQFQVTGHVAVNGVTGDGTYSEELSLPGTRLVFNNPTGYPASVTTGTSWQNTLGKDVFVTIPITFAGTAGTAKWNVDVWSGLPAGTASVAAGTNVTIPITFVHYANRWARVDVTNGTIGTPITRWV